MAIRMIGVDLDGTLFDGQKRLTAHTRAVLEQAIARGVTVVPATGRPKVGVPPCLLEIPGIRYAVVTNGGAIYDLRAERCIYENCMDRAAAADLLRRTRHLRHTVQSVYLGTWGYMEEQDRRRVKDLPLVQPMKDYICSSRWIVEDLAELILGEEEKPQKVVLMFSNDARGNPIDRAEAERIVAEYPSLVSVSGGVGNIEMMDRSAGKGTALLELGRLLGISRGEIMAVGDSENDLDMIEKAGLGVVMANGEDIVKQRADALTLSNDEDGCAAAIEKYVLRGRN